MRCRPRRPKPPDEVDFPVTPMLDMAFQLLAFFIMTFQAPARESRIDLYLPSAPAALPGRPEGKARSAPAADLDLENDLIVRAEADARGALRSLKLGDAALSGPEELRDRLTRYARLLAGRPLRVRLVADDALRYGEAARVVGSCAAAGVAAIRLAGSGGRP